MRVAVADDDDVLVPRIRGDESGFTLAPAVQGNIEHVIEAGHVAKLHGFDGGGEFRAVPLFLEREIPLAAAATRAGPGVADHADLIPE